MRGESMKGKSKKSTYSTTFGIDPDILEIYAFNGIQMVYGRESQNTGCRASLNASFQPTFPALMLPTQLMVSPRPAIPRY